MIYFFLKIIPFHKYIGQFWCENAEKSSQRKYPLLFLKTPFIIYEFLS